MENNLVENSSVKYPKLNTNLLARHGIERKLKESFLTPLKLPFEGSYCRFGVKKVSTCDKCLQTELLNTGNLENVVSRRTNGEELNVDVQLVISLTDASGGSGTLILSPSIEYKFYSTNSHFDKTKNYMDFESACDSSKRPNQVAKYDLKIDCQSLLTYMKNINQKCAANLDQGHRSGYIGNELYPVIRNRSSRELKCEIHESGNFETYKKISRDRFNREPMSITHNWNPLIATDIGIDRNLCCKYLPNNNEQLLVTNSEDPCVSNFAKTLLSCLETQPKKESIQNEIECKMIADSYETKSNDIVGDLKTKIEEMKEQLLVNSPIDALLEVCGPKSHITDMILNRSHQKRVVHKQSDSRFRTVRKISNTDVLSQTNSNTDDECLKLDFRSADAASSSKQSERSTSRPSTPSFEIENFYMPNNSLDYLKNEVHVSLKSNVNVIDTLYNLHDNVLNMENNLVLFHQYICSIKSEIGHLIFKHTCKQTQIEELVKHFENESKKSNLSSLKCNELCEKYCKFDGSSSNEKIKTKTLNSSQIGIPLKFQVALSVFFVIGFICGDFVKQ